MIKFVVRRIIQAIPTLFGITIIAYLIMFLAPGNPATQLTFNPELSSRQRAAMAEALGANDPFHVQYLRWFAGDAPYIFAGTAAWAVEMNNGKTVYVNANNGDILAIEDTTEEPTDVSRQTLSAAALPDNIPLTDAEARSAATEAIEDARAEDVGYVPAYDGTIIWEGRQIPVFDRRGNQEGTRLGETRGLLRGDFGLSVVSKRPVLVAIGERLPATIELGLISLLVGLVIGIPIGVLAAVYQGSWFDQITRVMAVFVSSVPVFWLGLILLLIFGSSLGWLPMGNRFPVSLTGEYTLWDRVRHLILPVFTLSSFSIATYSRYMRASLLDVLGQDYVRTAQAKGLSDRKVWFKHALRNALIPIATILGPSLTLVISGAVLTETIYGWPGMGRLLVDSVRQLDYPIIMGVVILVAIATVLGYLISDILYAIFDPRVRLS